MSVERIIDPWEHLRPEFERLHGADSFGFRRSRKGTYANPAIARDWKWFKLGAQVCTKSLTSWVII